MTHQHAPTEPPCGRSLLPLAECIHHLFEAQAVRTPDSIAIVFEDQHVTYRELDRRANQLARHLQSLGVGPEARVGMCLERSLDLIVGMLGILKAGGAYLPIDPQIPADRLAFMFTNAQVSTLLTQERLSAAFPPHDARMICIEAAWPLIAQERDDAPNSGASPEQIVYVLYTSGSTGRPKGVAIEHRQLSEYLRGIMGRLGLPAGSSYATVSTFAADLGNTVVFPSLCGGGCLHIIAQERTTDPDAMADYMYSYSVECLKIVPSHLAALLSAARPERVIPRRRLVLGGEAATSQMIEQVRRLAPKCRIFNHYGPTETTVGVLTYPLDAHPSDPDAATPPLGYPLPAAQAYILDAAQHLVDDGEAGELYIGGSQLARGYLDHADLTAARFIPNPFDATPGARMYRTGDRARRLPDGAIIFLGRVDHQVKIRGFRIELGEIESTLKQHPSVQAAIALAREDAPGNRQIVAYVVPLAAQALTPGDLRAFLRRSLPEYMIPAAFVLLTSLPLTSNGKIDRNALPAPDRQRSDCDASFVAPRTPIESLLADIWANVLGRAHIGIHDHFFGLGGHSLLAAQVVSRVRATFQVELSLRSLFDAPTVAELAEAIVANAPQPRKVATIARLRKQIDAMPPDEIRALVAGQTPTYMSVTSPAAQAMEKEALLTILLSEEGFNCVAAHTITPRANAEPAPLSFAQQRLWFLDQLAPGSPFYNLAVAVRLRGPLMSGALADSLDALTQRHASLRTIFAMVDGQPVQIVAAGSRLALPLIDLRGLDMAQRAALAEQLTTQAAQQPFDLARGPLFRALLLRLDAQEHVLLITMHHAISDGWSVEVLFRELGALYAATLEGRPAGLPALPIQYADYALWQRRWLRGAVLGSQLAYWTGQLADAPALLELPTDRPRPATQTFKGAVCSFRLPADLCAALSSLSRQEQATIYMTLLATWQLLLARYSGQRDIVVGTPIAGRTLTEVEGMVGFFANTLVMRTDMAGNPSFRELLGRVRANCLGAYAHQDLPFDRLVEELRPERNLSFSPLIQVMFALQNEPTLACGMPDLEIERMSIDSGRAKFDVALLLKERGGEIAGELEYNTDLFDAPTIARMADHFQTLLEGIAADPDRPAYRLPMVTPTERQLLRIAWNDTRTDHPVDRTIQQLIEEQVGRTPDAIALTAADRTGAMSTLTYGELNRRANQLAHHLRALGARPEARVGVRLPRSLDLVIALLAVLKAGSAYVPIDPAYPAERRAFLLDDSQAHILVTNEEGQTTNDSAATFVNLPADWSSIAHQPATNPPVCTAPDQLAYVIYTSGSTGRPKGVQVDQRGVLNLIGWHRRAFAVDAHDRATQVAGPAFDATGWEIWPYLTCGASLHMPCEETRISPAPMRDWLIAHAITVSFLPTPLAERLITLDWPARTPLRALLTGGDRLHFAPPAGLPFALVNNYGPTESSVVSTSGVIAAGGDGALAPTIGRPIDNIQLYVLDAQGQETPIGVPGELYIGGSGLARGYLGRSDLTAERFVPNPFAAVSNMQSPAGGAPIIDDRRLPTADCRLYRTGDLVRYRADGAIEFLGRIDQQVQVRGFRVELGEIEATLAQHPAVQEAAVLTHEAEPGDLRLVAYVVTSNEFEATSGSDSARGGRHSSLVADLRAFLGERLPDYMLPAVFVLLEALPLSANGKLDRRALPALDENWLDLETTFVAPRNAVEEVLAQIWADVLGHARVGIHDNFFELGGHSLLATHVIAQITDALEIALPLSRLFEMPTVADLAASILQFADDALRIERTAQWLLMLARTPEEELEALLGQELAYGA